MASYQASDDYNFYKLDTLAKNWQFQSTSEVEPNQAKKQKLLQLEYQKPTATEDMLILNFGQALDVYVKDWRKLKAARNPFRTKMKAYHHC